MIDSSSMLPIDSHYSTSMNTSDTIARILATLFACDRLLKLAAVIHFFRQPLPRIPSRWPSVTLLQPVASFRTQVGMYGLVQAVHATKQRNKPKNV